MQFRHHAWVGVLALALGSDAAWSQQPVAPGSLPPPRPLQGAVPPPVASQPAPVPTPQRPQAEQPAPAAPRPPPATQAQPAAPRPQPSPQAAQPAPRPQAAQPAPRPQAAQPAPRPQTAQPAPRPAPQPAAPAAQRPAPAQAARPAAQAPRVGAETPPQNRRPGTGAGAAAAGAAAGAAGAATAAARPPAPPPPPMPAIGPVSGLPLPRFVSLRSDQVNMRVGPNTTFPIEWTFQRRDLPVQIIGEFQVWRRIRDVEGAEGWVHQSTLAPRRTALVRPGAGTREVTLRRRPEENGAAVARLQEGVITRIRACDASSAWCEVQIANHRGFVRRAELWGVGAEEEVK